MPALIDPPIHPETGSFRGGRHELPHTDCGCARIRIGGESALDEREVHHVFREPCGAELRPDHWLVAGPQLEALGDALLCLAREAVHVELDPGVGLIRPHIDVPGLLLGSGDGAVGGDANRVAEHRNGLLGHFGRGDRNRVDGNGRRSRCIDRDRHGDDRGGR
jgi:hypothetical protein